MRSGEKLAGALAVAAMVWLSGCASGGVSIPAGYELLEPCPPQFYSVEALSTMEYPGCDLEGSTIVAPDGSLHVIGPVGHLGVSSSYSETHGQGPEYTIVNWGVPGVGFTRTARGEPRTTWASTAEALKLQRK